MRVEMVVRGHRLHIRIKNNLANRLIAFFWNDLAAGLFLGIGLALLSFGFAWLAIFAWFIRFEIMEPSGFPARGTYGEIKKKG